MLILKRIIVTYYRMVYPILIVTIKHARFGGDILSIIIIYGNFSFILYIFSLFETSQSLFWASFGLIDLVSFELTGTKEFTRFWALLMFGSYSVINVIVLLNMLIAMMSNSYQIISVKLCCMKSKRLF